MAQLVETRDARLAAGALGDQQGPHGFHVAVRRLGDTAGSTRQHRPGSLHRVDGVGLAEYATKLTVGAVDLDHLEPLTAQVPSQAGAIGTGAFHSDTSDRPEAGQPPVQRAEALRCRRERLDAQHAAVGVERRRDMGVEVRVDPARDRARLYDGHCHPFSVQSGQGWHARPVKETVSSRLRQQQARSPSRTGRATFQGSRALADKHPTNLGAATTVKPDRGSR